MKNFSFKTFFYCALALMAASSQAHTQSCDKYEDGKAVFTLECATKNVWLKKGASYSATGYARIADGHSANGRLCLTATALQVPFKCVEDYGRTLSINNYKVGVTGYHAVRIRNNDSQHYRLNYVSATMVY